VQPDDFIQLAKRLLDNPHAPEADCRQAAHAAYYAVYHIVCAHFRIDPTSRLVASHSEVRGQLKRLNPVSAPPEIREAKRVTERLFALRVRADYDLKTLFTGEDAEDALELAKGVLARVKAAPPPPPAPVPAEVTIPAVAQSPKA
jgi:uncharacterized protein (UPF0332 family)